MGKNKKTSIEKLKEIKDVYIKQIGEKQDDICLLRFYSTPIPLEYSCYERIYGRIMTFMYWYNLKRDGFEAFFKTGYKFKVVEEQQEERGYYFVKMKEYAPTKDSCEIFFVTGKRDAVNYKLPSPHLPLYITYEAAKEQFDYRKSFNEEVLDIVYMEEECFANMILEALEINKK